MPNCVKAFITESLTCGCVDALRGRVPKPKILCMETELAKIRCQFARAPRPVGGPEAGIPGRGALGRTHQHPRSVHWYPKWLSKGPSVPKMAHTQATMGTENGLRALQVQIDHPWRLVLKLNENWSQAFALTQDQRSMGGICPICEDMFPCVFFEGTNLSVFSKGRPRGR